MSDVARTHLRVAVVGAGMAGILAAIRLREAGYGDVVVYEKADRVGGTWRENTYPGLSCDVPSHFYSYSFALNPEWTHRFSPGPEILAYFEDVARRWGIDALTRYGREVTRCVFERGRWRLVLSDGSADDEPTPDTRAGRATRGPDDPDPGVRAASTGRRGHGARP